MFGPMDSIEDRRLRFGAGDAYQTAHSQWMTDNNLDYGGTMENGHELYQKQAGYGGRTSAEPNYEDIMRRLAGFR